VRWTSHRGTGVTTTEPKPRHTVLPAQACVLEVIVTVLLLFYTKLVGDAAQGVPFNAPSPESDLHAPAGANASFPAIVPQKFPENDFDTAIAGKLESAEADLVVNPLTYTPQMQRRARELTIGATNDTQRARMIFDAVVGRADTSLALLARPETAQGAYDAWDSAASQLGCQELAFLYVALTRALGLTTFHVFVERDSRGLWLLHGCAAFFTGTNAVLVDPAYYSFGARHQRFAILDDVQTAGLYLACTPGLKEASRRFETGPSCCISPCWPHRSFGPRGPMGRRQAGISCPRAPRPGKSADVRVPGENGPP